MISTDTKKIISNKKNIGRFWASYVFIHIISLFVFASFSNTQHVFFQVAASYQIWQASVFLETLSLLPYFWNPIDISPLCSPTFLFFKDNLFNKYNIPYFTKVNLITLLEAKYKALKRKKPRKFTPLQAFVYDSNY